MKFRHLCASVGLVLALLPGAALAESSRMQIIIGGEAYDGPPRFQVTFDSTILGHAAVEAAIDTDKAGRFADAADKTPYVQSFDFIIPDDLFRQDGEVRIRLVNEAYGGPGSNRDRNLYLAAVAVNGAAVTVSGLVTAGADGFKPNEILGEFLVLSDGAEEGVSPAPRGGWPMPNAVVAELVEPRLQPTIDLAASPAMLPVPGLIPIEVAEPDGIADVEIVDVEINDVEVADVSPPATAAMALRDNDCELDQIYNVVGFNENSNDLTPRLESRLHQIIEDIGDAECRVLVTGYSSTQGDYATNALFAVERAQNVLRYMRQNGLRYRKATAAGGGATEQFGPDPGTNRRVVVTVIP